MRAFATRARTAPLLIALALAAPAPAAAAPGVPAKPAAAKPAPAKPAVAKPFERRLHPFALEASSFLWNDSNKFLENYHPSYAVDDDPATAWVEGAKSNGPGERLGLWVGWLNMTTRVRVRVRNGCQKSKDVWKANARAKEVDVSLVPQGTHKKVTLTDTEGWQEIVVDMPAGSLSAVELEIGSVYAGTRSADLCISDVQVFATSTERDDPVYEKRKLADLTRWRSAQLAAVKLFAAHRAELPLYPSYEVRQVGALTRPIVEDGAYGAYASTLPDLAMKDPGFATEWKDALTAARAIEQNLGSMTRAQLAPASQTRLVEVHGLRVPQLYNRFGVPSTFQQLALQLPMLGLVSAMFAEQLRVVDVQTGPTIAQYEQEPKDCGTDRAWVARTRPKEGPSRVAAIAIGRCAKMTGRGGFQIATAVEIMIYDSTGKLVLVSAPWSLEGYRWTMEGGKPMLAGGRSMQMDGSILETRRATPAPAP